MTELVSCKHCLKNKLKPGIIMFLELMPMINFL